MNNYKKLLKKINEKKAKIAVIGVGYVGLPLAILLTKAGFNVSGYTKTRKKMKQLTQGISDIGFDTELQEALKTKKLAIDTVNTKKLQENDIYIICVPTPINARKKPDLSSLQEVAKRLSKLNLDTKLIINESTVAPFTTKTVLGNLGQNYFLVCSPERIDPGGNKTVKNIPKIIGAVNQESLELGLALYEPVLQTKPIVVPTIEVAEMSKMLENTYRAVNIALVNEFAKLADALNIDITDVITAAKSKWSYQAHYPGIGVGGHCIPVDPYYVLKLAQQKKIPMDMVAQGLKENESMPFYVAQKVIKNYKKGIKILVYGLTYKKNVKDLRESPVIAFCHILKKKKIPFTVYDPLLTSQEIETLHFKQGNIEQVDMLIVGTDHKSLQQDSPVLIGEKTLVVDGKNYFIHKVGKKVIGVGRILK